MGQQTTRLADARHGDPTPPGTAPVRSLTLLGTRVDDVTFEEAEAIIADWVARRARAMVVTPNPEIVMAARRQPALRRALAGAGLAIPDGIGLLLAARLAGDRLRQHVRGTDLVHRLAARSRTAGWRWFLLGGGPGVAEAAARYLRECYPGLQVVGTFAGRAAADGDTETRARLAEAGAVDILLVAYGAPRQELWMVRNLPAVDVAVAIGVGGVLDFFAGRRRRAPAIVRRLELEWLWRLAIEPSRWRRQLALPRFAFLALAAALTRRWREARLTSPPPPPPTAPR